MGDDMREMGEAGDKKGRTGGHDPFKMQSAPGGMGGPGGMSKVGGGMGGPGGGMGMDMGHQRLPMMVSMPSVRGGLRVREWGVHFGVRRYACKSSYRGVAVVGT